MDFPSDSKFFTFNYTSTVESVYNIKSSRVLHIHGSVDSHDELVFGHGKEIAKQPEFDEDGESTGSMFSEAKGIAMYPLVALKKQVEDVLNRHKDYFYQLSDIREIIIIGHSLNSIDWPYFTKIAEVAVGAKWKVVYYDEEEESKYFESLVECGVLKENIVTLEYSELI